MPEQNKQFKDFDICDFEDMGNLPKRFINATQYKTTMPFIKSVKGVVRKPYVKHPVSSLADVI